MRLMRMGTSSVPAAIPARRASLMASMPAKKTSASYNFHGLGNRVVDNTFISVAGHLDVRSDLDGLLSELLLNVLEKDFLRLFVKTALVQNGGILNRLGN